MPESLLSNKPILLLGASGKLGLEIRKAMQSELSGRELICCSRSVFEGPRFPNERWIIFDPFESQWDFGGPIAVVINAVGAIAATKEMPYAKVHLGLTKVILAHRFSIGDPKILQLSAIGADPQHKVEFLRSKGEADELLKRAGNSVIMKPSIVCTPNTMLSQKLNQLLSISRISLGKLLVPNGFLKTQIQPIMGADLGRAVVKLIDAENVPPEIELVGPNRLSFGEILEIMAKAKNRKVKMISLPREFMEGFVKHFLSVWFPGTINYDQFQLLFQDNVGNANYLQRDLGLNLLNTDDFWRDEAK